MATTTKKFGLLKGLSDIYICEINDSEEGYTPVGTPEKLIPAGEITITKSFEKAATYFDNTLYDEVGTEPATEMSIVGAAVRSAFIAWLEGKTVDSATGAVIDDGEFHNKYFAISGKKDYTDGTSDYFWFLKCSFGGAEESSTTKDDTTDSSGMTLPFTAYKTQYKFTATGKTAKVVRIDTSTTKVKDASSWVEQVVTPDNLGTICEKITAGVGG